MGSSASDINNADDGGAPDVSTDNADDLNHDMPYTMLGPVSRVYVSEAAWQAKTRAQRQETLDLEPKLIEAALQQHQDKAEEAERAQGQEAVDPEPAPAQEAQQQQHETVEAIRARADIHAAQLAAEVALDQAQRLTRATNEFRLDGTRVVTVRREVRQVDGYA
ncbi:unnamed protein product, partial [Ectocarpus fasciculatus]